MPPGHYYYSSCRCGDCITNSVARPDWRCYRGSPQISLRRSILPAAGWPASQPRLSHTYHRHSLSQSQSGTNAACGHRHQNSGPHPDSMGLWGPKTRTAFSRAPGRPGRPQPAPCAALYAARILQLAGPLRYPPPNSKRNERITQDADTSTTTRTVSRHFSNTEVDSSPSSRNAIDRTAIKHQTLLFDVYC